MIKYFNILLFFTAIYAIDCDEGYVENSHDGPECIPEEFVFNTSINLAGYFFMIVTLD